MPRSWAEITIITENRDSNYYSQSTTWTINFNLSNFARVREIELQRITRRSRALNVRRNNVFSQLSPRADWPRVSLLDHAHPFSPHSRACAFRLRTDVRAARRAASRAVLSTHRVSHMYPFLMQLLLLFLQVSLDSDAVLGKYLQWTLREQIVINSEHVYTP